MLRKSPPHLNQIFLNRPLTRSVCLQDGQPCVILEGEHRLLPAVRADLTSLLQSIKAGLAVQTLKLPPVEAAVFKQQSLAAVGSAILEDIRKGHVWCEVDGSAASSPPALGSVHASHAGQGMLAPDVLYASATVGTHRIEVSAFKRTANVAFESTCPFMLLDHALTWQADSVVCCQLKTCVGYVQAHVMQTAGTMALCTVLTLTSAACTAWVCPPWGCMSWMCMLSTRESGREELCHIAELNLSLQSCHQTF